jgi:hypothetical protein
MAITVHYLYLRQYLQRFPSNCCSVISRHKIIVDFTCSIFSVIPYTEPRITKTASSNNWIFLLYTQQVKMYNIKDGYSCNYVTNVGLNLNGTHQLLAYADDVNILGGSVHTVKENAEALVVATRVTGLEVNVDKSKYVVMSRDRNARRGHSVKIDNSSTEGVEKFKYLGTT